MGDFNARTRLLKEYCTIDKHIIEELDIDIETMRDIYEPENILYASSLPIRRANQDLGKVNASGHKLIELCPCFVDFDVLDFSPLYSDVHSPITFSINTGLNHTNLKPSEN